MSRSRSIFVPAVIAAVLLLATLSGCATRIPPGVVLSTPKEAWTSFRQNYCVPPKAPALRVKASLQYSRTKPTKRTNRTLITLWGDFDGPMRLDVSASIGTLLAHIREERSGLLVFYPEDKQAYTHVNPVLGATRLGMPFPFSLSELASVMAGDFSGLTPGKFAVADQNGTNFVYTLDKGLVDRIILDEYGRPLLLEGRTTKVLENARSWVFEINRYEDALENKAPLPGKLTLALDNGEEGVLHIKSRELMPTAWPAKSLALALPEGVEPIRLDNGYLKEKTGDIPVVHED
ncbi:MULTISPECIES: hypothetical protein [unclassified Pseudodesulfovibrio]|uniref:hypothetical protein n=1 Tax=unclassified Pseudodesulfovibrio TaxID=2661612 RepID=UPI000FEBF8F2|nr:MULTISPECIES: hypothetical protein [unclassified Pseudodesulfovibrio]MCJ2166125.1 hypothetical protein [Pseudodesulfovibrio sp. S3-i]RWU02418.1 hypothetical protein DWB63_16340 [Pseudodesulfovibrio sp. S3]